MFVLFFYCVWSEKIKPIVFLAIALFLDQTKHEKDKSPTLQEAPRKNATLATSIALFKNAPQMPVIAAGIRRPLPAMNQADR